MTAVEARSSGDGGDCAAIVVKIGGSVLVGEDGWRDAVTAVRRERDLGKGVLVVVSATAGTTESLLQAARKRTPKPEDIPLAQLLRAGEESAVALMVMALHGAGIGAECRDGAWLDLVVTGPRLEARPVGVDASRLRRALDAAGVLVVPGFLGRHAEGGPALLGRGGSDLTAVFLAARLGVPCRLIKDVDGLYEFDPARAGPPPRRYTRASWETVLDRGAVLVQHHAARTARELDVRLSVSGVSGVETIVDAGPDVLESGRLEPEVLESDRLEAAS